MCLRIVILVLVFLNYLLVFQVLGNDFVEKLGFNCETTVGINYGPRTSLDVVEGTKVLLHCDVSCLPTQGGTKWIEWTRENFTKPVLVKYVNYEPYIDPELSNRVTTDPYGRLSIYPVLTEDSSLYRCTTYTLKNHVATFHHGTAIKLNILSEHSAAAAVITQPVQLGLPALLDCQIQSTQSASKGQLLTYIWTRDSVDVTIDVRFTVLISGSLYIRATRKQDAGIYKCTAKSASNTVLPMVYRGVNVNLDILYAPVIVLIKKKVNVAAGNDVQLPCISQGNPSLISVSWLWNNEEPLPIQSKIFENGTLHIKNIKKNYEGNYTCTPSNKVGAGTRGKTILKVEGPPVFTLIPPKTVSVSLGDKITLVCGVMGDARIDWRRLGSTLPEYRSYSRGGRITVTNAHLEDSGTYECKATTTAGSASHVVELTVLPTPLSPVITSISVLSTSDVIISWKPDYHIGSMPHLEIWCRVAASDDTQWQIITGIPPEVTSYTVQELEAGQPYLFSLRGVNEAGCGAFSNVYYVETSSPSSEYRLQKKKDKPLPPHKLHLNVTHGGYLISWSYSQTPTRPAAQFFRIQYRAVNTSLKWTVLPMSIGWSKRQWLIRRSMLRDNSVSHEFQMLSFAAEFSLPSDTVAMSSVGPSVASISVSGRPSGQLVVISIVSVAVLVILIGFVYWACHKNKSKTRVISVRKIDNGQLKPSFTYSSAEACASDSESDPWELDDVKIRPYLSTFVRESRENADNPPRKACKSKQSVTLGDEYIGRAASTLVDKSNLPNYQLHREFISGRYLQGPQRDPEPTAFKTGCLLPEFPELRDSYDQFCTTLSANSSNEDLETNRSSQLRCSMNGNEARVSRAEELIPDDAHLACKRRKKTVLQEASGVHEKYQRWSMPEFTKLWYEIVDSDTDDSADERIEADISSIENVNQFCSDEFIGPRSRENYNFHQLAFPSSLHSYTDLEQQISGPRILDQSKEEPRARKKSNASKESASCPDILRTTVPPASLVCCDSLRAVCDDNSHGDLFTSTPDQRSIPVEFTTTPDSECSRISWQNRECHHLRFVDESSDGHDSTLGNSSLNCEASMCTSDSGYSGMSNGTPEGEEQCHICEKEHTVCSNELKLHKAFKDLKKDRGKSDHDHVNDDDHDDNDVNNDDDRTREIPIDYPSHCDYPVTSHISLYPDVVVERSCISEVRRNKHCAQLVKEFRIIKNLHPGTTCSTRNYSLYRTYEV